MEHYKKENLILRKMLWLSHGHTGIYGDDGEMQCSQCIETYGFWDWKRTPAEEIESKIIMAKMKEVSREEKSGD